MVPDALVVLEGQGQWDRPQWFGRLPRLPVGSKTPLIDLERLQIRASRGDGHQGETWTREPVTRDHRHRMSGRRLQRSPEVGGGSVPVLMGFDVALDAPSERFLAKELLEHAQHRRAL